jgi:hypothetical protein
VIQARDEEAMGERVVRGLKVLHPQASESFHPARLCLLSINWNEIFRGLSLHNYIVAQIES